MDDLQDPLGGKRKYKENPLTAKAETGSLKIKIMRKGETALASAPLSGPLDGYALAGAPRSPPAAPAQPLPSPPKPRANRKHVPIFYQRPNAFDLSASTSTSTDDTTAQTSLVTSDYDATFNSSTSSTTGQFARLDIAPGLPGSYTDPMPLTNPLFTRGMSETSGSLTDLLKTVLPSINTSLQSASYNDYSSASTLATSEPLTTSQSSLLNPAAALRQLASSSAGYSSHPRDTPLLPSMLPSMQLHNLLPDLQTESHDDSQNGYHDNSQNGYHGDGSLQQVSEHQEEEQLVQESNGQEEEQPNYRFDAMSALQNAVKIAVASTSPPSAHPTLGRWLSSSSDADDNDLGPPPSAPPGLAVQHSLMGGGIEAQPVIPTINTVNFNWNRYHQDHPLRSRSSSIPNVATDESPASKTQSTVP